MKFKQFLAILAFFKKKLKNMKRLILPIAIIFFAFTAYAQKITVNKEANNIFPKYKKTYDGDKIACISGDCENGEGILLKLEIWDVSSTKEKRIDFPVLMNFYVGKFEDNGKYFTGKRYVQKELVEHKAENYTKMWQGTKQTHVRYNPAKDIDFSAYTDLKHITRGVPRTEGSMIRNGDTPSHFTNYLPNGKSIYRDIIVSTETGEYPYKKYEGIFNDGKPVNVKIGTYRNEELKYLLFNGLCTDFERYKEGKLYQFGSTDTAIYYMGEMVGNLKHGRGYMVNKGAITNNGFWFLDEFVKLEEFPETAFINYDKLPKATIEDFYIAATKKSGTYSGTVLNNKPHGFGSVAGENYSFHGYFKNGVPQGAGTYTYLKEIKKTNIDYILASYIGLFNNGKIDSGKTSIIEMFSVPNIRYSSLKRVSPSESLINYVYSAYVINGRFDEYERLNGKSCSKITYSYKDKSKQKSITRSETGDYKNGLLSGWCSSWISGLSSENGHYYQGKLHGEGVKIFGKDSEEKGIFHNGELIEGTKRKGYSVQTGKFQNGKLISGTVVDTYKALKPNDAIVVNGKETMVTNVYVNGQGDYVVQLLNGEQYSNHFDFRRSASKKASDYYNKSNCSYCYGTGTRSSSTKTVTMPQYSVETYTLVTTKVTKTTYTQGSSSTYTHHYKCNVCDGKGYTLDLKR